MKKKLSLLTVAFLALLGGVMFAADALEGDGATTKEFYTPTSKEEVIILDEVHDAEAKTTGYSKHAAIAWDDNPTASEKKAGDPYNNGELTSSNVKCYSIKNNGGAKNITLSISGCEKLVLYHDKSARIPKLIINGDENNIKEGNVNVSFNEFELDAESSYTIQLEGTDGSANQDIWVYAIKLIAPAAEEGDDEPNVGEPADFVYDFAAAAAAGENPDNFNGGDATGQTFYIWESAEKTDSKRTDYKGYTNYTGTNLPAECHVWRRSDRINGNIGDGGLKCPNDREMVIDGLKAGNVVTIEYTAANEGDQILWASSTAEEHKTVAVIDESNKAAISGTTTIASGAKIRIASTPGYFGFKVKKNMVITKITISEGEAPADVVMSNTVTVAEAENGTVSVDKAEAFEGETVTITAAPAEGYEVDTIKVVAADETEVTVTDNTFVMPAQAVTVTVTFKEKVADGIQNINAADADNGAWYNLNGVRVEKPTKGGIYIHNGKKVVIK